MPEKSEEVESLAQKLIEAVKKDRGAVTPEGERQIREFAESFLLLLDDTEE